MGAPAKVLVVDDSPQIREFYRLLLRKTGYVPVTAADGDEALKYVANNPAPFALIILDLLMPGRTGWETLMQIRETSGYEKVPVIVITGIDLPQDQLTRLQQYCQRVLLKSDFSLARIRELLAELLPGAGQKEQNGIAEPE